MDKEFQFKDQAHVKNEEGNDKTMELKRGIGNRVHDHDF